MNIKLLCLLCLLLGSILAACWGCCRLAPRLTRTLSPSPVPTATTSPTATPTRSLAPTRAATHTATAHFEMPTARPTSTPASLWEQIVATLPQESNQSFRLTITEEQLARLIIDAAENDAGVDLERLTMSIHPDSIRVTALARFKAVGRELDLEVEIVPAVVDGQVRLRVNRLEIRNYPKLLSALIAPLVTNILDQQLDLFNQMQQNENGDLRFQITGLHLREGAMIIEGVTN